MRLQRGKKKNKKKKSEKARESRAAGWEGVRGKRDTGELSDGNGGLRHVSCRGDFESGSASPYSKRRGKSEFEQRKPQERRSQSLSTGALPRRRSRATKRGRGEIWRKASRRQVRWWAEGTALSPVRIPLPLICPCLLFFDSRGRSFEQKPACLTRVQEGFAKSQQRLTTSHRVER